jgi:hypothetical protein
MRSIHVGGRGAFTPFGPGKEPFLTAVFEGRSALRPLDRLAGVDCLTAIAAEVSGDVVGAAGDWRSLPFHLAREAGTEALLEAGDPGRERLALIVSTTKGDLSGICGSGAGLGHPGRLAEALSGSLSIGGPRAAVSCACASGLAAVALGCRWMLTGRVERVLVIGTDSLSPFVLQGFSSLLALDPGPCRPFDSRRKGLSLGEAAGALLLTIHAEESIGVRIAGWGESNDANHITGPSRDGGGLQLAASRALVRAGMSLDEVAYIHLHGTGTVYNDAMEANAMARLFGGLTAPASGTKQITGHTLGAAGVIESLIAIEALRRGEAPADRGLEESDVAGDLRLLRERQPLTPGGCALKLAAGFGGINAVVAFA